MTTISCGTQVEFVVDRYAIDGTERLRIGTVIAYTVEGTNAYDERQVSFKLRDSSGFVYHKPFADLRDIPGIRR